MSTLPTTARVIIVGGGAMGCSLAYHLASIGVSDVVLLERNSLTSGTTWHSAAQVRALRSSRNLTHLIQRSIQLYQTLEAETGLSTGWINRGSLSIATNPDRLTHIRRQKALADLYKVDAQEITQSEAAERWPLMNSDDVVGAVWSPDDGRVSPSDLCQSLIKGAKQKGVKVYEQVAVEAIHTHSNQVHSVVANGTTITCENVALCSGLWSRDNAALADHPVPVWPCHHYYLLTQPLQGFEQTLPTLSDHDQSLYIRDDSGGLLVGCFEAHAKAIDVAQIGTHTPFQLLQEDWDHFEPVMQAGLHRIPALADAEVRTLLNGPESFTPDGNFLLGESGTTKGLFFGCGMNSVGLASAGGAGWALAQAIARGEMPFDLGELDPGRFHPCYSDIKTLSERVPEVLGKHYAISYPGRQWHSARNQRKLPLDALWREHGAVMGETNGWERPLYFDTNGNSTAAIRHTQDDDLTFGKPPWFENVRDEVSTTATHASLFELSTFGRFRIQGTNALAFLQYLCSNSMDIAAGRCCYTLLLNDNAGIAFDAVVFRFDTDTFMISVGSAEVQRAASWLGRCYQQFSDDQSDNLSIENLSDTTAALSLAGPTSDLLLSKLVNRFSAPAFFSHQTISINDEDVTLACLSYTGERGFELICPSDSVLILAQQLLALGAKPAGLYAQTSMRIEKGLGAYRHEMDIDVTPADVGLQNFVKSQPEFSGRRALQSRSSADSASRLIYLSADVIEPLMLGNEPVYLGKHLIGKTTSAAYGFRLNRQVAIAQVDSNMLTEAYENTNRSELPEEFAVEVDVAGQRVAAIASQHVLFDAESRLSKTPGAIT